MTKTRGLKRPTQPPNGDARGGHLLIAHSSIRLWVQQPQSQLDTVRRGVACVPLEKRALGGQQVQLRLLRRTGRVQLQSLLVELEELDHHGKVQLALPGALEGQRRPQKAPEEALERGQEGKAVYTSPVSNGDIKHTQLGSQARLGLRRRLGAHGEQDQPLYPSAEPPKRNHSLRVRHTGMASNDSKPAVAGAGIQIPARRSGIHGRPRKEASGEDSAASAG